MDTGSGSRYSIRSLLRLAFVAAGLSTCSAAAAPVEIVAHRGGYLVAPENTCAAFRACSGLVDRIEFDIHASADGELVVIHDATVNRTAAGCGAVSNVADLTLAELKQLDVGSKFSPAFAGERIPTLAEALRALPPGVSAMVHRKTGAAGNIVAVLRAENVRADVVVAADDYEFLIDLRQREANLQLCYTGEGSLDTNSLASLRNRRILSVAWNKSVATPEWVEQIHAYGLKISLWSINTPEIEAYLDLGVDGLLVNNPPQAKNWRPSPPASNAQLSTDLVAYWKLDDGLADPAASEAGDVEDHGTLRLAEADAAPAWIAVQEARFGGALSFDGTNDFALAPSNEFLDVATNAVSISLWVKLSSLPSTMDQDFAGIYDSVSDSYVIYLDRASRELRFKVTTASLKAARPGIPESLLHTGVWHHVVGVYDGSAGTSVGQALVYLDGRVVDVHCGSDSSIGYGLTNLVRSGQVAAIGRSGTVAQYHFSGAVDDVAVWRRALSPVEIRQIHAAGTNGLPLEKNVMTLWIENVYPDLATGEMVMDVRVDHGSLTNQALVLHGAVDVVAPYSDQAVLEGRRGRRANFHVPRSSFAPTNAPRAFDAPRPNFFRIACP